MNLMHKAALAATATALMGVVGTAQAAFEGRDATGAASATCTATGLGKCTYFYDTTLDITILNNWNIGPGSWSSMQAQVASEGFAASVLSGWVLPTGDFSKDPGPLNQIGSIWISVGGSFSGLSAQFDGVQSSYYWSSTALTTVDGVFPLTFLTNNGVYSADDPDNGRWFAVAVRPGDVAVSSVPEPQTYAMMLAGLGALMVAVRRRPR